MPKPTKLHAAKRKRHTAGEPDELDEPFEPTPVDQRDKLLGEYIVLPLTAEHAERRLGLLQRIREGT